MTIHHVAQVSVLRVEERFRTMTGAKRPDGKHEVTSESLGWWALLDTDPKIWVFLGDFKPEGAFSINIHAYWSPT